MALPVGVTTATITFGPYLDAEGNPAITDAEATLKPVDPVTGNPIRVVDVATGVTVVPASIPIAILGDGTATVGPIPHTDNAGLSPVGFAYYVEWKIASNKPSPGNKTFALPTAAGATADFDLLVIADGATGVLIPTHGVPVGGTTGQVLAKASGTDFDTEWVAQSAGSTVSDASTTVKGIVELATNAETTTGTDTTRAVTPAGLKAVTDALPAGYTDEQARDAIGTAIAAGTGVTKTVDDAGDTITIGVTPGTYAPASTPTWVGARTGRYDPVRSTYMPAGASLHKSRAALGQAIAGVAQARILALGDSTVAGTSADRATTSWPARVSTLLANAAITVGGSGVALLTPAPVDTRWVLAGGFASSMSTSTTANGFFGGSATTSGATATFTSTNTGTIVDIYYAEKAGAWTYAIDGGAPVSVAAGSSTVWRKATVTGLANTTHTVVITSSSASQVMIMGAEVRATTGVSVTNIGLAGTNTAFWTGATWSNPINFAAYLAPHLSLVCLGINDRNGATATSTYSTNLTAVVTSLQASGDVILINPNRINVPAATNTGVAEDPYYTVLYDVADAKGCPVVDIADRMGTWTQANTDGTMSDTYHPSPAGYAHISRAVAGLLTA